MAIALTDFEAMCGFRPLPEIVEHLSAYPELADIVGEVKVTPMENSADYLKSLFSHFMHAPEALVLRKLEDLVARLSACDAPTGSVDALILRLNKDFPGDRGALCPLILNYIKLKSGSYYQICCVCEQFYSLEYTLHAFLILCVITTPNLLLPIEFILQGMLFSWGQMALMPIFLEIFWSVWHSLTIRCALDCHPSTKMLTPY